MREEKNGYLGFESSINNFLVLERRKHPGKKGQPHKSLNYLVTFVIVLKKTS
jgi:hypothetical protein